MSKKSYRLLLLKKEVKERGKEMIDKLMLVILIVIASPILILGAILSFINKMTGGKE